VLKSAKDKTAVYLIAEDGDRIIGLVNIELGRWRKNHIGTLGISIGRNFRGIGLGKHLMREIIKLAKRELKPRPKIIQLEVFANNKPAINLYKKTGFKQVAKLPKQLQWKGRLIDELVMILYL